MREVRTFVTGAIAVAMLATVAAAGAAALAMLRAITSDGAGSSRDSSLHVSPLAIDFGTVAQGEAGSRILEISNRGDTPVALGGWGVTGGRFTFVLKKCDLAYTSDRGALLPPGRACTVKVIALTYGSRNGLMEYFAPGRFEDAFYVLDSDHAELVRIPLVMNVGAKR
jgi:hypothetical protein